MAAVSWPDTMAREEVRTVIGGCCAADMVVVLFVAEKRRMVPSTERGCSAMISLEKQEAGIESVSYQGQDSTKEMQ